MFFFTMFCNRWPAFQQTYIILLLLLLFIKLFYYSWAVKFYIVHTPWFFQPSKPVFLLSTLTGALTYSHETLYAFILLEDLMTVSVKLFADIDLPTTFMFATSQHVNKSASAFISGCHVAPVSAELHACVTCTCPVWIWRYKACTRHPISLASVLLMNDQDLARDEEHTDVQRYTFLKVLALICPNFHIVLSAVFKRQATSGIISPARSVKD